jgi:hypothetical protein
VPAIRRVGAHQRRTVQRASTQRIAQGRQGDGLAGSPSLP